MTFALLQFDDIDAASSVLNIKLVLMAKSDLNVTIERPAQIAQ